MPLTIASSASEILDLEGCINELEQANFKAADQESFILVADSLKRLANQPRFFG